MYMTMAVPLFKGPLIDIVTGLNTPYDRATHEQGDERGHGGYRR